MARTRSASSYASGLVVAVVMALTLVLGSDPVAAQPAVELEPPTASGDFGEPLRFEMSFRSDLPPDRVELVTRLPGAEDVQVSLASVERSGSDTWTASVVQVGHTPPNTSFDYAFRVVTEDGTVTGPSDEHVVRDLRFEWQELAGDDVTVWWYDGDRAAAERALAVAEDAVDSAVELLGVSDSEPVDFFIYADGRAFREALGPATRENVGGEAHPSIRTLFGLIEPGQAGSDWVSELIRHEIAHIAFDETVSNPYRYPPRWLNEGFAVYLAKGYDDGDRAQVEAAVRSQTFIPLEGLAGQFPTRPGRFGLAYAESVAAVDHLIRTHGEAALGRLIRLIGEGATLDEAFVTATGTDLRAFEDGWLASLDAERPEPYGPQPGEPGPVPEAWSEPGSALLR
jgi:hypothetical protein